MFTFENLILSLILKPVLRGHLHFHLCKPMGNIDFICQQRSQFTGNSAVSLFKVVSGHFAKIT